jgi:hypothetical protein
MPKRKAATPERQVRQGNSGGPEPADPVYNRHIDIARTHLSADLFASLTIDIDKSVKVVRCVINWAGGKHFAPLMYFEFPFEAFKDEAQVREWAAEYIKQLKEKYVRLLIQETVPIALEIGNKTLYDFGILRGDLADVASYLETLRGDMSRVRLGVKRAGRPPMWTKEGLAQAIIKALQELLPREQNLEGVAQKLREWHGERAPASKGALRQQVIRVGINWRELKREAKSRKGTVIFLPSKE